MKMDIASLNEVSGILAAIGVLVGVVLTVMELRNLAKQRQTDLVMRLYSTFITKQFQDAYETMWTEDFKDYNDVLRGVSYLDYARLGDSLKG